MALSARWRPGAALAAPSARQAPGVEAPTQRARAMSARGVLVIAALANILASLDLFIVNVAFPDIARGFGSASLDDMSWLLNGYAIAYAALLVFFGRMTERHRRNLGFLWGIGLFTAASAACAAAQSVGALVAFRVVQATGAALMTPTSIGLLLATFPPERRAGAVRTWAALGGFAGALGPLVGGLLITLSWRWIFIINVPVGLMALGVGFRKLPDVPGHDAPKPTLWAAALATISIGAPVLAIVKVNDWGWTSPGFAAAVTCSLVAMAMFARHCLRSANPFIDMRVFAIPHFRGASLIMACYSVAFGGLLLSVPLWEQSVWHWSAVKSGVAVGAGLIFAPSVSLALSGHFVRRWGAAVVVSAGLLFMTAAFVIFATCLDAEPNPIPVVIGMVPASLGIGLTLPTIMGVGTSVLPNSSFATGSGVINMIRQAWMAVGVAVFVAILGSADVLASLPAFAHGWWVMAAFSALALLPVPLIARRDAGPARPIGQAK
jgi:EmrB/QacA subfamily drug resistance transporter